MHKLLLTSFAITVSLSTIPYTYAMDNFDQFTEKVYTVSPIRCEPMIARAGKHFVLRRSQIEIFSSDTPAIVFQTMQHGNYFVQTMDLAAVREWERSSLKEAIGNKRGNEDFGAIYFEVMLPQHLPTGKLTMAPHTMFILAPVQQ